ncbi:unnamed protein product [Cercospora beticola]|nr:unnamed protein product [Cercospora beticola]
MAITNIGLMTILLATNLVSMTKAQGDNGVVCPADGTYRLFCSRDGSIIVQCDPNGRERISERCPQASCQPTGYGKAFCAAGGTPKQGQGATSCAQVAAYGEGAFTCDPTYSYLYQCFGGQPTNGQTCCQGCCTATGGRGSCHHG